MALQPLTLQVPGLSLGAALELVLLAEIRFFTCRHVTRDRGAGFDPALEVTDIRLWHFAFAGDLKKSFPELPSVQSHAKELHVYTHTPPAFLYSYFSLVP